MLSRATAVDEFVARTPTDESFFRAVILFGRNVASYKFALGKTLVELALDGMTMVVVTHEMGFARKVANKMVFMDAGEIVEEGPPIEFFENPKSERCQTFLGQILQH